MRKKFQYDFILFVLILNKNEHIFIGLLAMFHSIFCEGHLHKKHIFILLQNNEATPFIF